MWTFGLAIIGVFYAAALVLLFYKNETLRRRRKAEACRRAAMTPDEQAMQAQEDWLDRQW